MWFFSAGKITLTNAASPLANIDNDLSTLSKDSTTYSSLNSFYNSANQYQSCLTGVSDFLRLAFLVSKILFIKKL